MMKNTILAASMLMLVAVSGPAFARATASHAQYWPEATAPSSRPAMNAFDPAMATPTAATNAHRYEGGPKSND